jgi:hypothetical protein
VADAQTSRWRDGGSRDYNDEMITGSGQALSDLAEPALGTTGENRRRDVPECDLLPSFRDFHPR